MMPFLASHWGWPRLLLFLPRLLLMVADYLLQRGKAGYHPKQRQMSKFSGWINEDRLEALYRKYICIECKKK